MNKRAVLIVGGVAALVAFVMSKPAQEKLEDWGIVSDFRKSITEGRGKPYSPTIESIGARLGLPPLLLSRVAYQESRFRSEVINGTVKSGAGAVGMFQIIPRWHPAANPLDWREAAEYAGRYLLSLNQRFGDWGMALAAYNWGQGNLSKYGIERAPLETRNYFAQILADVPGTGSRLA